MTRRARTFVIAAPSIDYAGSATHGLEIGLPSGGRLALSAADCARLLMHRQRQRLRIVPPLRALTRRELDGRPAVAVPRLPAAGWAEAVNVSFRRSLWRVRPRATDEETCCVAAVLHAEGIFGRPLEPIPDAVIGFLESLVGRRAILESRQLCGLVAITDLTLRSRDADDWLTVDLLALGVAGSVADGAAGETMLRIDHVRMHDLCELRNGSAVSRHGSWALHMDPARVARWNPRAASDRRGTSARQQG